MRILGLETSCDETAAAVVEKGTKILASAVASSVKLHQKTGGIIPEVAAREQVKAIIPVIEETLKKTAKIDALAVTVGPGLIGSLLVGVETAKTLAYLWRKPIIPVNHLQAHLYANFIHSSPQFPAVGLVVSGGHTDLVLIKNHRQWQWLGGTRDDAAGECFDKTARALGLGYPGGPAIAATAAKFNPQDSTLKIHLPRPMLNTPDFDFSFSGLKTAVVNQIKQLQTNRQFNSSTRQQLAFEIQAAIVEVLVEKTIRAVKKYQVKSLLLAGGVAANQLLREQLTARLQKERTVRFLVPPPKLCTDNAVFIASRAYFNYQPVPWPKIQANPSLKIC